MRRPSAILVLAAAIVLSTSGTASAGGPDLVQGRGANDGWFSFSVRAHSIDGADPRGMLRIDEVGAENYDVDGPVVCMAVSDDGAVVAAARPDSPTTTRVVFLAVRAVDRLELGPDRAAPAFTVVPAGTDLSALCAGAIFLVGGAEPLDRGHVHIRDA